MPIKLDGFLGFACVLLAGGFIESDEEEHCTGCKEEESASFQAWNSYPGKSEDEPCTCGWMTNTCNAELRVSGIVYQVQISFNGTPSIWIKEINSFSEYLDLTEKIRFGHMEVPQYKYKDGSWSAKVSPNVVEHIEKTISMKDTGFYDKVVKARHPEFFFSSDYAFGSNTEDEQRGEQFLRDFISQ